jgi:DNA-binding response OmpR family regulator
VADERRVQAMEDRPVDSLTRAQASADRESLWVSWAGADKAGDAGRGVERLLPANRHGATLATILVADDDQLLRAILRDHLERADHTVLEAGDGIAAIDIALDERPACLLLDVMMPLARGLEVVRRVRQEEDWRPTIAMISARTRVTDRLNALDAGADVYFEKPVEPENLLAVVERLLRDAAPSRIVDVLGPIWSAVAIDRLVRDAMTRRSPARIETTHLEAMFADLVAGSIGSASDDDGAPAPGAAVGLLWEDTLRALLKDASDEPIPTTPGLAPPDAWAAVEQLVGDASLARHRATLGGSRPAHHDRMTPAWSRTLRDVLGDPAATTEVTKRVRVALGGILRADDATGYSSLDPLQTLWLATANRRFGPQRVEEPA